VRHAHDVKGDRSMEQAPTPSFLPTGRTRVLSIIGHPIKQVRSPIVVNTELARRGVDAVLVPIDIETSALGAFFTVLRAFENTPGAIVTIPHKIASVGYVDALSDRARLLGAVNMVRRLPGGRLEGDMSDGLGFLAAAAQQGVSAQGKSVAVFGGGAVGRAVLLACCEAGASRVAFHEPDGDRRAALQRLADSAGFADRVTLDAISTYPEADIAVNASPLGMRPDDPLPFAPDRLAPHAHVADVVTDPEISPLLAAARACGLTVQTGRAMAESQRDIQLAFFGLDQAGEPA
jgi:shikimate dehydrogenase